MIDLHCHSTESDGSFSPAELVQLAVGKGLRAIALTDHDTVSGIASFLEAAKSFPQLEAIAGVEISCAIGPHSEVHILGLFIDPLHVELNAFLNKIIADRNERNQRMIETLNKLGYEISQEDLNAISSGESIGRPLFAKILIERGYFKEPREVFDQLLRRGCKGYVARKLPSPSDAIDLIKSAGGIAIWAHPMNKRKNERAYVRNTLNKLLPLGIDGLESYYTVYDEAQHKYLVNVAESLNLLQSGGSDFHGVFQPTINMATGYGNLSVPDHVLDKMHTFLLQRKGK